MISSAEEFVRLRSHGSLAEQRRAGEEAAPTEVWFDVISRFPELRDWVAHNKTVPLQVLELLARDSSSKVRCVVASKRKLTAELRSQLARDTDPSVRARVAYNAKCEIETLRTLANDPESFVKEAAVKKLVQRAGAA